MFQVCFSAVAPCVRICVLTATCKYIFTENLALFMYCYLITFDVWLYSFIFIHFYCYTKLIFVDSFVIYTVIVFPEATLVPHILKLMCPKFFFNRVF